MVGYILYLLQNRTEIAHDVISKKNDYSGYKYTQSKTSPNRHQIGEDRKHHNGHQSSLAKQVYTEIDFTAPGVEPQMRSPIHSVI